MGIIPRLELSRKSKTERRGRDSNPRSPKRGQLISNQSPSTTRPPLHTAEAPVFRIGMTVGEKSAPKRTRTSDLWFRKPSLYPAELWAPVISKQIKTAGYPYCCPAFFPGTLSHIPALIGYETSAGTDARSSREYTSCSNVYINGNCLKAHPL